VFGSRNKVLVVGNLYSKSGCRIIQSVLSFVFRRLLAFTVAENVNYALRLTRNDIRLFVAAIRLTPRICIVEHRLD
jgi:hypothetical protein